MSLFHYSDLNAVVSVLQNKKIWLTDIRYLNDKREFLHGIERLLNGSKIAPPGLFVDPDNADQATQIVRSKLEEISRSGANFDPIYICSLSRAENLLSQWRGYGQYAIEFDEAALKKFVPTMSECIYDPKNQEGRAYGSITDAIQTVSKSIDGYGDLRRRGEAALSHMLRVAATFKDEGFAEEREVRLVLDGEDLIPNYRVRNNLLIPYIELAISLDCIKAIHIGPVNERELAEKSLRGFCRKIESDWQKESRNDKYRLAVKTSTIPYRTI